MPVSLRRSLPLALACLLLVAPRAAADGPPLAVDDATVAWATADGAVVSPDAAAPYAVAAPVCARNPLEAPDAPPAAGELVAAGGGVLLWQCGGPAGWPLAQPVGGAAQPVPGAEGPGWAQGVQLPKLRAVGAAWILVDGGRTPDFAPGWLNWRSGDRRYEALPPGTTFDLDRPGLARPLCAPLRASAQGVTVRGRLAVANVYDATRTLAVHRCGRRAPVFEHACRQACTSVSLGPAGLVWVEGKRVRAWQPSASRAVTVARLQALGGRAAQTRERIVVGTPTGVDGPWTISTMPTPGAGRR